jgi:hypothetical protein
LAANCLNDFQVVVDFKEKFFTTKQDGKRCRHSFFYKETAGRGNGGRPVASLDLAGYKPQITNAIEPRRTEPYARGVTPGHADLNCRRVE